MLNGMSRRSFCKALAISAVTTSALAFRVVHDHVTSVFRHEDLASALEATDLTEADFVS